MNYLQKNMTNLTKYIENNMVTKCSQLKEIFM